MGGDEGGAGRRSGTPAPREVGSRRSVGSSKARAKSTPAAPLTEDQYLISPSSLASRQAKVLRHKGWCNSTYRCFYSEGKDEANRYKGAKALKGRRPSAASSLGGRSSYDGKPAGDVQPPRIWTM